MSLALILLPALARPFRLILSHMWIRALFIVETFAMWRLGSGALDWPGHPLCAPEWTLSRQACAVVKFITFLLCVTTCSPHAEKSTVGWHYLCIVYLAKLMNSTDCGRSSIPSIELTPLF